MNKFVKSLVNSKFPSHITEKLAIWTERLNGNFAEASFTRSLQQFVEADFNKYKWLSRQTELQDEPREFEKKTGMSGREHYKDYAYKHHYFRKAESPEVQLEHFKTFITNLIKEALIHETENPKIGVKYLEKAAGGANIHEAKQNASPELEAMIEEMEAATSEKETMKALMECTYPESTGPSVPENALYVAKVGEIEVDPHGMKGKIAGKEVPDLYDALGHGLFEDDVEKLSRSLPLNAEWDYAVTDIITIPAPMDHWAAVVDEKLFEAKLEKVRAKEVKKDKKMA